MQTTASGQLDHLAQLAQKSIRSLGRLMAERRRRAIGRHPRWRSKLSMALLVATGCLMGAVLQASGRSQDETSDSDQPTHPTHVTASPAPDRVSAFAWIRPQDGILVLAGPSTEFGYRIVHLDVAEGDMVEPGQSLAELDVKRERAANLAITKAQVLEAEKSADFATRELARKEQLAKARSPSISVEDLDTVRRNAQVAVAKLEVARRQEAYAEIMLEQATIRAPAAGMVLRVLKHEGEGFTPGDGLMQLGRVAQMEAVAEVFETDVRFVAPGQIARFSSPALANPVSGKVLRVMPRVERVKLYETNAGESVENRVVRVVIGLEGDKAIEKLSGLQGIVNIDTSPAP